jgi:hypothetical protein
MIDLTIVEWGDPVGGLGFVHYPDPERPPAGKPFQKATAALVSGTVGQPPEGARDSARHPVWSLRCVLIDSVGPHWCFAVQGRGGKFGQAGSCQFAFAPADVEPRQVWATCVQWVGADGRLGYQPANQAPSGAVNEQQISGVLTGLAERRSRIAVDGEPVDVAAAIARLLDVVPVEDVRAYVWVTYLLRRPVLSEHPTVTGRWPAELRASKDAKLVNQWLNTASGEPSTRAQHPRWPEAVTWLAGHIVSGSGINRSYRLLGGMPDLLDTIVDIELGLRPQDVSALLDIGADRLRSGTGPVLVRQWARADPQQAISRLRVAAGPEWLDALLLEGLLEANKAAAPGENPALLPPVDEHPFTGWHERLALLLRRRYADPAAMADFVRRELKAPGRPMADRNAVEEATPWLQKLGLSPNDPASGIFPVPTNQIVRCLKEDGHLSPTNRRLLASASDFAWEARRVVDGLGYVAAPAGTELLQVATVDAQKDQSIIGDLARYLLWNNDQHGDKRTPTCDVWLLHVLDGDLPSSIKALLIDVGIDHLTQLGSRPLPAAFLRRALELEATELGLPQATRRVLLLDSAERLQLVAEQELIHKGTKDRPVTVRPRSIELRTLTLRGARRKPGKAVAGAALKDRSTKKTRERSGKGHDFLGLLVFLLVLVIVVSIVFSVAYLLLRRH